jgi:hypothetical protein
MSERGDLDLTLDEMIDLLDDAVESSDCERTEKMYLAKERTGLSARKFASSEGNGRYGYDHPRANCHVSNGQTQDTKWLARSCAWGRALFAGYRTLSAE